MDSSLIIHLGIIRLICNPEGYLGIKINLLDIFLSTDSTWKTPAPLFSSLRTQFVIRWIQ